MTGGEGQKGPILPLSVPLTPLTSKTAKTQNSRKILNFILQNIDIQTNDTIQKYCWRSFMVTP